MLLRVCVRAHAGACGCAGARERACVCMCVRSCARACVCVHVRFVFDAHKLF